MELAAPKPDALLQEINIGDKEVITHQLALYRRGQPSVLTQPSQSFSSKTVFDRVDRILGNEMPEEGYLLVIREQLAFRVFRHPVGELLVVVVVILAVLEFTLNSLAAQSTGDAHVTARLITGILDSLHDAVERILNASELGSESRPRRQRP
jgi:hypothetical protein